MLEGGRLLIVGLGNPGKKYHLTRHNIGFLVLESLAENQGCTLKEKRDFNAFTGKFHWHGIEIHLLLPQTFMNLSGRSVRKYSDYFKIESSEILVVTDDVAIPFKEMRLRSSGGSGGHNGLKSIEQEIGTSGFKRLRMGVGSQRQQLLPLDAFVLEEFSSEEQAELSDFVAQGRKAIELLLTDDMNKVMSEVNKRTKKSPKKETGENIDESK